MFSRTLALRMYATRRLLATDLFVLYTEQFGSVGLKGGRLMVHGVFTTKKNAEDAIEKVKKELDYNEDDPSFFFGIEKCTQDVVYAQGVVKERLSKASVYD